MARYTIESIPEPLQSFYRELGVWEGDEVEAPNGFPKKMDEDPVLHPVTLTRRLHPNIAQLMGNPEGENLTLAPIEEKGDA